MDKSTMNVEGVLVIYGNDLEGISPGEVVEYVNYAKQNTNDVIKAIELHLTEDGNIEVEVTVKGPKFERIRRITGYPTRKPVK